MLNTISVLFGGRIAEEVFMDQMTTGASNDFERATAIARDMVTRYGMTMTRPHGVCRQKAKSSWVARLPKRPTCLKRRCRRWITRSVASSTQYALARKLIEDNQDKMHAMAKALLEWETIDAEQIEDIMSVAIRVLQSDWSPSSSQWRRQASNEHRRGTGCGLIWTVTQTNGASAPFLYSGFILNLGKRNS